MSSWNQSSSAGGTGRGSGDPPVSGTKAPTPGQPSSASRVTTTGPAAPRVAIPSFREVHQPQRMPSVPSFFQPKSTTSAPLAFDALSSEGPNKRQRTSEPTGQQTGPPPTASGLQLPPFRGRTGVRPPQPLTSSSGPQHPGSSTPASAARPSQPLTSSSGPQHPSSSTPASAARAVAPLKPTLGLPQYRDGAHTRATPPAGINRGNTSGMGTGTQWSSQGSTGPSHGITGLSHGSTGPSHGSTGLSHGGSGLSHGSTRVGASPGMGAGGGAGSGLLGAGGMQSRGPGNWSGTARPAAGGPGPIQAAPNAAHSLTNNQVLPPNAILVNKRQQGNPILKHIRNVRWVISDIIPDYQLGEHTCALFLSLRYHLLHPDYILHRMKELQKAYRLSVVVCHVDVEDVIKPLAQITKLTISNDCTLICAWSPEECARYLETLKSYQSKPATAIQERVEHDYVSRLTSALTAVRGVNKTDAVTLGTTFGSLADIIRGKAEAFSACPGIGPTKVHRLVEAFHEPFKKVLHAGTATGTPTKPPGARRSSLEGGESTMPAKSPDTTADAGTGGAPAPNARSSNKKTADVSTTEGQRGDLGSGGGRQPTQQGRTAAGSPSEGTAVRQAIGKQLTGRHSGGHTVGNAHTGPGEHMQTAVRTAVGEEIGMAGMGMGPSGGTLEGEVLTEVGGRSRAERGGDMAPLEGLSGQVDDERARERARGTEVGVERGVKDEMLVFGGVGDEDYEWLLEEDRDDAGTGSGEDVGGDVESVEEGEEEEDDDFMQQADVANVGEQGSEGRAGSVARRRMKKKVVTKFNRPRFLPRGGTHQLSQLSQPVLAARAGGESEDELGAEEF